MSAASQATQGLGMCSMVRIIDLSQAVASIAFMAVSPPVECGEPLLSLTLPAPRHYFSFLRPAFECLRCFQVSPRRAARIVLGDTFRSLAQCPAALRQ